MISLFMHGGPSHVDLLDPKPELHEAQRHGLRGDVVYSFVNRASKKLFGSPWKFAKHGQCGTEVSELLPHTAGIVDDICVIRSMHTGHNGHEVSIRYFHGGIAGDRPAGRRWGAGSSTAWAASRRTCRPTWSCPTRRATRSTARINWSSGFMPPLYQGTVLRPQEPRILNLDPPPHLRGRAAAAEPRTSCDRLNRRHLEQHPGEADLEARIASYELAAAMQTAAKEALDISQRARAHPTPVRPRPGPRPASTARAA